VSVINPLARELSAKIVYYGPGLSGKTSSLQAVYSAVRPERRGEMVSLATETDRTIFFDFLPLHVERVQGLSVRFQLYTVPGQVFYGATRRLVLNGADGVVFVADSQEECRDSNLESYESLRTNIADLGVDLEEFPLVLQYNKRDLPGVMPIEDMSVMLNFMGAPEFPTCATTGEGILPALKAITKATIKSLIKQQPAVRRQIVDGDDRDQHREQREPEDGIVNTVYSMSRSMADAARDLAPPPSAAVIANGHAAVPQVALPEPQSNGVTMPSPAGRLSFTRLWPKEREPQVREIEDALAAGDYAAAVRSASALLAEMIDSLPGPHGGAAQGTKAALLGLDGALYLRVCRLATMPPETLSEADALLAFHVLISARLKTHAFGF
jgi:signal recognition particle receptor subunit beta